MRIVDAGVLNSSLDLLRLDVWDGRGRVDESSAMVGWRRGLGLCWCFGRFGEIGEFGVVRRIKSF